MTSAISAIICTHNRPQRLAAAVDSLLSQSLAPAEIILISDGLPIEPAIIEQVKAASINCIHRLRTDPGLPASRNLSVALASGEIIAFFDDDVVLPPDYLARLASLYACDVQRRIGGIGGLADEEPWSRRRRSRIAHRLLSMANLFGPGPRRLPARYQWHALPSNLRRQLRPASWLQGCLMSFRREIFQSRLRFDENLSGYALAEDREFCGRACQSFALYEAPELRAAHHKEASERPDGHRLGRMIVSNTIYVQSRIAPPLPGDWLIWTFGQASTAALHSIMAAVGRQRRYHAQVVSGMFGGWLRLIERLWACT